MNDEENALFRKNGRIFQINRSRGGVPKIAIEECELGELGLLGDIQSNLEVHGGPERALCLYSLDKILKLQSEEHPVFPGALGENITITGLPWESVLPGVILKTSRDVKIQVTTFTSPCKTIEKYFIKEDYSRISQKLNPGWSRVYAQVLEGGTIKIGDKVFIEK
jgi:MOSC domain-containing protein YiiM